MGIGFFIGESASVQSWCWRCHHSGRNKLGVGRRRKRRRKILVSNGTESANMQVQGMAAEVWRSIFCMGKLLLHWPHFLASCAWESGLCSAEALVGMLSLGIYLKQGPFYFEAAAEAAGS